MVKVLHTSDWHLGARLYERPRLDEAEFFLKWLRDFIREEEVNTPPSPPGRLWDFIITFSANSSERTGRG